MGLYLSINFNDLKDLNLLQVCLFLKIYMKQKIYMYYLYICILSKHQVTILNTA